MIADKLLDRLEGVRETAPSQWVAKCPAHEDRSPSLSIREVDNTVLIYCHASCSVYEILNSVSLTFSDLYPPRDPLTHSGKPVRRRPDYKGAWLSAVKAFYLLVIATADVEKGKVLSELDRQSVALARDRIYQAMEVVS